MSTGFWRLNAPERMATVCEEGEHRCRQIIAQAEDPVVDEMAEELGQLLAQTRVVVCIPAGRMIRELRRDLDGDELWPPEPARNERAA